jgi:hypothetical protein
MHIELLLGHMVPDPEEAHVDGFRPALLDSAVGDPGGARIIRLDGRGRLRMPQFEKGIVDGDGHFAIMEEGPKFGLGRRRYYNLEDGTQYVDVPLMGGGAALGSMWVVYWGAMELRKKKPPARQRAWDSE